MEQLTEKEIELAKSIISKGLDKAAESLSFFMKEQITLKETDFNISEEYGGVLQAQDNGEKLFVLSTEVKGELKGICYLVFDHAEKDEICKVALPPEIVNNPDKLGTMQEPLLLEIDNIISASVITQLANHLKQKVFGDVPQLHLLTKKEFRDRVGVQMIPDKLIIGFHTEFVSSKSHFRPKFFWILEPEFINCVKSLAVV